MLEDHRQEAEEFNFDVRDREACDRIEIQITDQGGIIQFSMSAVSDIGSNEYEPFPFFQQFMDHIIQNYTELAAQSAFVHRP